MVNRMCSERISGVSSTQSRKTTEPPTGYPSFSRMSPGTSLPLLSMSTSITNSAGLIAYSVRVGSRTCMIFL